MVRLYLVPQLGKVKLTALKTADVRGMLNRIRQQCQCCAQNWDDKRPESERGAARSASAAGGFPIRRGSSMCSGHCVPRWVSRWPRKY